MHTTSTSTPCDGTPARPCLMRVCVSVCLFCLCPFYVCYCVLFCVCALCVAGFDRRCLGRNHRAVLVGHKIVFFGGGHQDTSSLLFLDTRTLAWSCPRVTLGRPPLHRSVHGLALVGRYLLVVAGKSSGREINDMHALDLLAELEDRLPPAEAAALAASVSASASASVSPAGSTNTSRTVSVSVRGPEPASAFASTATLAAASSQTQTQAQPHTSSPRGVSDEARNSLFNWLLSRLGGS